MSSYDDLLFALSIIGAIYVVKTLLGWLSAIYCHLLRCRLNLVNIYGSKSSKPWVAITGPTGGLGFDYCREFAKQEFNILFIARNETKAQNKINELKKEFASIETHFIKCDLGSLVSNEESINNLRTSFETFTNSGKDIAVLVNNAGVEFDNNRWGDLELKKNILMVNVDVTAVLIVTQLLLPYFDERSKKGIKSLVINVGSALARIEMPGAAVYGACKEFMNYWSIAASKEYERSNIDFIVTNPGPMVSEMTGFDENKLLGIIQTSTYASSSMKQFGHWRSREIIGYWNHAFQFWSLQNMPREIGLTVRKHVLWPFFKSLQNNE